MGVDRSPLSSLKGKVIKDVIWDGHPSSCLLLIGEDGQPFASVNSDSLFDAHGNYFEEDL